LLQYSIAYGEKNTRHISATVGYPRQRLQYYAAIAISVFSPTISSCNALRNGLMIVNPTTSFDSELMRTMTPLPMSIP